MMGAAPSIKKRRSTTIRILILLSVVSSTPACQRRARTESESPQRSSTNESKVIKRLIDAAIEQTKYTFHYDPAYVRIPYPEGDVPLDRGVCTDVLIRAFRKVGVDLQKEVHEDMKRQFSAYPKQWGLTRPDPNIDHRRVPNLMTYFKRKGKAVGVSSDQKDYLPGDVVAWRLDNGLLHIGIVTDVLSDATRNYKLVHNIGAGAQLEDILFSWQIIGHYRYF